MKHSGKQCSFYKVLGAAAVSFAAGLLVVFALLAAENMRRAPSLAEENNGLAGSREAVRRAEEKALARRIVNLLEPLTGTGRVRAEVLLDVDYDTVATSEEIYDPDGQVLRSYVARANFASKAEYEINKYRRSVVRSGGEIEKMSVLVLVDNICTAEGCRAPTRAELSRMAALIAPVIGFEPRRGDVLQIENVRFFSDEQTPVAVWGIFLLLIVGGAVFFCAGRVLGQGKNICTAADGKNGVSVWKKLEHAGSGKLAAYLAGECPAAAAYVLLRLNRQTAEKVLASLPLSFAAEILAAMASSAPVSPEVAAEMERTLARDFAENVPDGRENARRLFLSADASRQKDLLSALEKTDPELAGELRAGMFNFEDFNAVGSNDIRRLFDEVEAERLAVALRGASERLKNRFFAVMSPEAAEYVKKEMAALGPVRLRDVEAAQDEIIAQAKTLAATGKIRLQKVSGGRNG